MCCGGDSVSSAEGLFDTPIFWWISSGELLLKICSISASVLEGESVLMLCPSSEEEAASSMVTQPGDKSSSPEVLPSASTGEQLSVCVASATKRDSADTADAM